MSRKKVIARVRGGLGNQLFIYAMARRLALKNDAALQLDIVSGFKNDGYRRKYLLHNFNIKADIATPYDSFEAGFGFLRRRVQMKAERFRKLDHRSYVSEEKRDFEPRMLNLEVRNKVYIDGLWQSERYFKDVEQTIREDLELVWPRDGDALEMADKIHAVNSVSLHGRSYKEVPTADYDDSTVVSMDYYSRAADYIARHVENPHFFCFSDDLNWLRMKLRIDFPLTFMDCGPTHENDNVINDLWLMGQCKHHIIANSTYSWWSAWLSRNPEKIVIAPHCPWQNSDYLPKYWIVL